MMIVTSTNSTAIVATMQSERKFSPEERIIRELQLSYYELFDTFEGETRKYRKDRQYKKLGWRGMTFSNYSDFEYQAILRFIKKIGYWKASNRIFDNTLDMKYGDVSTRIEYSGYASNIWCQTDQHFDNLQEFLDALPKRDCVMTKRGSFWMGNVPWLKSKNIWCVSSVPYYQYNPDEIVSLSYSSQDMDETEIMLLRLQFL